MGWSALRRRSRSGVRAAVRGPLVVLVVAAAVASLAGCGATSTSPATRAADQAYVAAVHGADPSINSLRSDTQLLRLGAAACAGFAADVSYFDLAETMQQANADLPSLDLGTIITDAADDLCPRYRDRVS